MNKRVFSLPINPKLSEHFVVNTFLPFLEEYKEYILDLYFTCRIPPFDQDAMGDCFAENQALIQSAKIFEKLLISDIYNLPISNNIVRNELLNSQYLKVNEKNSIFLSKAIAIYDSLSINSYDNEAPFYLAEIKYRIQGDLDGAKLIYQSILDNKRSNKFNIKFRMYLF